MTWYAWLLVGYIALDRLITIAWIGRSITITRTHAVVSMLIGALIVWAVVSLAGGA